MYEWLEYIQNVFTIEEKQLLLRDMTSYPYTLELQILLNKGDISIVDEQIIFVIIFYGKYLWVIIIYLIQKKMDKYEKIISTKVFTEEEEISLLEQIIKDRQSLCTHILFNERSGKASLSSSSWKKETVS